MTKVVTAHQPNYIPWIGLFSKISHANCYVVADTFALGKQSTFNRNKIRTNVGWGYLTIPIGHKAISTRICDITSPPDKTWQNNHWQTIYRNYIHTNYFKEYKDYFEEIYRRDYQYLWQINLQITLFLMKCFNIQVEVIKASEMDIDPDLPTTDFIIAMVKGAGGHAYLSGPSGIEYMVLEKFFQQNINLKSFVFTHPVYKQRYPGFEPNMSAIDLLFNLGPQAAQIIKSSGVTVDESLKSPYLIPEQRVLADANY
jgi:hypothetical protein